MQQKLNYSQYDETPESLNKWFRLIQIERIPLYNQISHHIEPNSTVLEIGAGSAWLSSLASTHKNISHIFVTELNERRLNLARNYFSEKLNANLTKISFHKSNFHNLNFIQKKSIDLIFVDAALHHTDTLDVLLKELYRVLKNNGKIIALREPILPSLPLLKQFKRKNFGKKQIAVGDIEHTYTKKEWVNYFANNDFNLSFHPIYSNSKKDFFLQNLPANKLNGLLFSRYYLLATKK